MQPILPRLIRLRDASPYLGMDKNRFNKEVRPYLCEIKMGSKSIGFDRLDLDEWFEEYKTRNGRPCLLGDKLWDKEECRDSSVGMGSGTLISKSKESVEFEKALEQAS